MTTIQTYLYNNRIEVQFWADNIFATRNFQVYNRPVTVYQGIDNPITVIIKTQNQQSANLASYIVQADLQDVENKTTLMTIGVELVNPAKGYGRMIITKDLVNSLNERIYKLTFKKTLKGEAQFTPLYGDMNNTLPIDLYVEPGFYSTTISEDRVSYRIDAGTL